jgi:hypothetical protein
MTNAIMEWDAFLRKLGDQRAVLDMLIDPADPDLRQEGVQLLAMSLAQGYHQLFSQDAEHPQFISFLNPIIKLAAPNPDYMYFHAHVDGAGTYRVTGNRGTALFAHVSYVAGIIGEADQPGPAVGHFDLDELDIAEDGTFEVILSGERPAGHAGNWRRLDPGATAVSIRQASYDWIGESDGRYAIERLDKRPAGRPMRSEEIAYRLDRLTGYPVRLLKVFLGFVASLQSKPVNTLEMNKWAAIGGLVTQQYYEGRYAIRADEALIIETEIPEKARYWSILLADNLFNTVDWVNCQSSLNGFQAQLDTDGKFRAVLSVADPGVPNWLDPAGRLSGVIQGRWNECSSSPLPDVKRVKLAELRDHLPADTPVVGDAERDQALRLRRRGAQYRRKW